MHSNKCIGKDLLARYRKVFKDKEMTDEELIMIHELNTLIINILLDDWLKK